MREYKKVTSSRSSGNILPQTLLTDLLLKLNALEADMANHVATYNISLHIYTESGLMVTDAQREGFHSATCVSCVC